MKAVVYEKYGKPDVLEMPEVNTPKIREDCLLVEIFYTSVTAANVYMRKTETFVSRLFLALFSPRRKILETEFLGTVVSVGKKVKRLQNGDSMYGFTGFKLGGYSEFACLSENSSIAKIPEGVTHSDAACLADEATTALFFLSGKTRLAEENSIPIIGASGSIGTYAVQIAKNSQLSITAVCSGINEKLVRQLGADTFIDYTKENFLTSEKRWDVVFDTLGRYSYE
jgi:NADPH:quinone reductase-like Zn-dependent oxidoreductase